MKDNKFITSFLSILGFIVFASIGSIIIFVVSASVFGIGSLVFGSVFVVVWIVLLLKGLQKILLSKNTTIKIESEDTKNSSETIQQSAEQFSENASSNPVKTTREMDYRIYGFAAMQAIFFSFGLGPLIHQAYYGPSRSIVPLFFLSLTVSFLVFALINILMVHNLGSKIASIFMIVFAMILLISSTISVTKIKKYEYPTYEGIDNALVCNPNKSYERDDPCWKVNNSGRSGITPLQ